MKFLQLISGILFMATFGFNRVIYWSNDKFLKQFYVPSFVAFVLLLAVFIVLLIFFPKKKKH